MTITLPSPRRIALVGLLLSVLVLLADGVARVELANAVSAPWGEGARAIAYVAAADD